MQKLLKTYLRRLTNLTGNNRSLFLRRLIAEQFLDLQEADFALPKRPAFRILEDLLAHKKKVALAPVVDARDAESNSLSRRLRRLQRSSRFLQEERGAYDLFVAWPFVRGQFSDGTPVAAPLLFFPVELNEQEGKWILQPREEGQAIFNKTFLLAYAHYTQLPLSEQLYECSFDKASEDSRVFRTELYQLLKDEGLAIHFNQELFIDQLQSFQQLRAKEQPEGGPGELKLYPEAVLGIFPQAGSYLMPDYTFLLQQAGLERPEELFLNAQQRSERGAAWYEQSKAQEPVQEADMYAPYPLDASQEAALRAVKGGESIVVQGPPGTGKSQLIANLVADAMAQGKRVLVVSQKKAALDVLHHRLDQKQLVDFVALVHDFRHDRKALYEQLTKQIERVEDYRMLNRGLDTIQLERRHLQASRRTEQLLEHFEAFRQALFDTSECGLSIKELYLRSRKDSKALDLHREYRSLRLDELSDLLQNLRRYLHLAARVDREDHPWRIRKSFASYGPAELQSLREVVEAVHPYVQAVLSQLSELLNTEATLDTLDFLHMRKDDIAQLTRLLEDEAVFDAFRRFLIKDRHINFRWLEKIEKGVMQSYLGEGPEVHLAAELLGNHIDMIAQYRAIRANPIKRLTHRYLNPQSQQVRELLQKNQLEDTVKGLSLLERRLDNRLNLEHYITELRNASWLPQVPEDARKISYQEWFACLHKARQAYALYTKNLRDFRHYFNLTRLEYADFRQKIATLFRLLRRLPQARERWKASLSQPQIDRLIRSEAEAHLQRTSLQEDFEYLCAYDSFLLGSQPAERALLERIRQHSPFELSEREKIVAWFQNSLQLAWIQHIETKYPILRSVSTGLLQEQENELQACLAEKAAVSQEMLLMRAREKTYRDLEYNRLNNLVSYRELRHQVSKRRKVWPLRKLLSQFADEVFHLIPCWMASPESVSAVFPMEEYFDLVIFDEASQCFVEKGIPALFRARQCVVVGDSQQLQPNDLYQIRWDESDEEVPETELQSLLDLARQHLPEVFLQTHYRSRAPELIDFSNRHFYGGRLRMLPERSVVNSQKPAIHFRKIKGVWENGQNPEEAAAAVALALDILLAEKERMLDPVNIHYEARSLGIVTFNLKQQQLIQELMEQKAAEQHLRLPDSFFVKNIENVQGDERDIILFSLAYAPDPGGVLRMQFGSLNREGGENRLNVAVTRAREEIYILSSIWPDELRVQESMHAGPKLFRAYLDYALQVSDGNYSPEPLPAKQAISEEQLSWKLQEFSLREGSELRPVFPFSDLTIRKSRAFAGLVLTDDNAYYQNPSLKDVHAYQYQQFEEKQWPYRRIYSRQYWEAPEALSQQLNRFIERLDAN